MRNCTITLLLSRKDKDGNFKTLTLNGIPEYSIESLSKGRNLVKAIEELGLKDDFIELLKEASGKESTYTSKEINGLEKSDDFFLPNISYNDFKRKYSWLPELNNTDNINILHVKSMKINGVKTPEVFLTRDVSGKPLYVVTTAGISQFNRYLKKYKAITEFSPNEDEVIPKGVRDLLSAIYNSKEDNYRFFSRFSDLSKKYYLRHKEKKVRYDYDGITVAKLLMLQFIKDPNSIYFYNKTSAGKIESALLLKNLEYVKLIKNAISSIKGYDTVTIHSDSVLANTIISKLEYGSDMGAKISLRDFKQTLKMMLTDDEYKSYFNDNIPIKDSVNSILNEYFYRNDTPDSSNTKSVNYDVIDYQVNNIDNNYIYFTKRSNTIEDTLGYTITTLSLLALEEGEYRGYKIYSLRDPNGIMKYYYYRGLMTPQSSNNGVIAGAVDSLDNVKLKIDSKLGDNSKVLSGVYKELYSNKDYQGISRTVKTLAFGVKFGQIIRALNVRVDTSYLKSMTRADAIANLNLELDLLGYNNSEKQEIIKQLDDNEKLALTLAKAREINATLKGNLSEVLDHLKDYNYYYIDGVELGKSSTIILVSLLNDTNTDYASPSSYLSMHRLLSKFAGKIQDRFGVNTLVMTEQSIKSTFNQMAEGLGDVFAKHRAFVITDENGNTKIIINSSRATTSDIAHEYMHIFMGIVRSNTKLLELYTNLLTELVTNTELGKALMQAYLNIEAYKNLSLIDFLEECAANIMGHYLSSLDKTTYPEIFELFRSFLLYNTYNNLSDNIIDFTNKITAFDESNNAFLLDLEKVNKTSVERLITNYILLLLKNNNIKEDCK